MSFKVSCISAFILIILFAKFVEGQLKCIEMICCGFEVFFQVCKKLTAERCKYSMYLLQSEKLVHQVLLHLEKLEKKVCKNSVN